jgi:Domain of unknown function (DUF4832)/Beta-galactosidase
MNRARRIEDRLLRGTRRLALLLIATIVLGAPHVRGGAADPAEVEEDRSAASGADPAGVTVRPVEIDDVLYNPGMGFADFQFGAGKRLSPEEYPPQTVAYFRWTWSELEPSEGEFNFPLVDDVIKRATDRGETLAFRIMSVYETSIPKWLLAKGVESVKTRNDIFPDHNNPAFLHYLERLIRAFGRRYAGRPEIDHVDIGSVGCWGEWNIACCGSRQKEICKRFFPSPEHGILITDWYLRYFRGTPLVMLIGGPVVYAASRGAGWRGDCFGDYGIFGPTWNHMDNVYGPKVQDHAVGNAWKTAPVEFEVCEDMQDWYARGFDIDRILQKGLEWHGSVLNGKSSPVPAPWRAKVDEFLKRLGYRFVLREMAHDAEVTSGALLRLRSVWENKGVAPIYHPWPLAYRLRSAGGDVTARWLSKADLRRWLPGNHRVEDVVRVPVGVPAGSYSLDVAILTEDASAAHVQIAIQGRRADRWYPVSNLVVRR